MDTLDMIRNKYIWPDCQFNVNNYGVSTFDLTEKQLKSAFVFSNIKFKRHPIHSRYSRTRPKPYGHPLSQTYIFLV